MAGGRLSSAGWASAGGMTGTDCLDSKLPLVALASRRPYGIFENGFGYLVLSPDHYGYAFLALAGTFATVRVIYWLMASS